VVALGKAWQNLDEVAVGRLLEGVWMRMMVSQQQNLVGSALDK
jgi:hypothetical protein